MEGRDLRKYSMDFSETLQSLKSKSQNTAEYLIIKQIAFILDFTLWSNGLFPSKA